MLYDPRLAIMRIRRPAEVHEARSLVLLALIAALSFVLVVVIFGKLLA